MLYRILKDTFFHDIEEQAKDRREKLWYHKDDLIFYCGDGYIFLRKGSAYCLPMFLVGNRVIFYASSGGANYNTGLEYLIGRGYIEECS